jgi:hypothetical protein
MSTTGTQQLTYEEFSRQYLKNTKVIDYTVETLSSCALWLLIFYTIATERHTQHLSSTFECVNGIIGRFTPEDSGSL